MGIALRKACFCRSVMAGSWSPSQSLPARVEYVHTDHMDLELVCSGLGSSRAGYFTLKLLHFVVAAAFVAVLAMVACRR